MQISIIFIHEIILYAGVVISVMSMTVQVDLTTVPPVGVTLGSGTRRPVIAVFQGSTLSVVTAKKVDNCCMRFI